MSPGDSGRHPGAPSAGDGLPPYAPRPLADPATESIGSVNETDVSMVFAVPVSGTAPVGPDHDAAEEAAAFAEAQDQGISTDRAWIGGTDARHVGTEFAGIDPVADPAVAPEWKGPETEPATVALPAVIPTSGDHPSDEPGAGGPAPKVAPAQKVVKSGFRQDPIRMLALGLGQTLITLGVVVLLLVVYEVYITDLFGQQKQEAAKTAMEDRWTAAQTADPTQSLASDPATTPVTDSNPTPLPAAAQQVTDPGRRTRDYQTAIGQGFANIYIPALGADYSYTIVEGTTTDDLYGNPGHYDDTQYPGELGNFAVAGHRVSKGSPFNALGTLNSCDAIVIETQDDWFVYRVLPMAEEAGSWNPAINPNCAGVKPLDGQYSGVVGRTITSPSDYAQVLPIPQVSASGPAAVAAATQRIITLTTCHPQFSDAQRMIIHGVLITSYAKATGFLPPEMSEG